MVIVFPNSKLFINIFKVLCRNVLNKLEGKYIYISKLEIGLTILLNIVWFKKASGLNGYPGAWNINHNLIFSTTLLSGYVRPGETRQKLGLTCGYCDAVFNSDYRAKIHYKAKHPGKPILAKGFKKYNCAYCTDFFFTEESLNCHLNLTHGLKTEKNYCKKCKQPYTETHDACPRDYKNPNKIQEKFVCTQCNGTYSR